MLSSLLCINRILTPVVPQEQSSRLDSRGKSIRPRTERQEMSLAASGCCGKFSLVFFRHVCSKLLQLYLMLCDPMNCRERLRAGGQGAAEDKMC